MKNWIFGLALTVAAGLVSPAVAGDDYDYGHANDNTDEIINNFNQKLAAMQLAIIEAMRLSTGQLSGNMREQSGAGHNLADQQDDRATVKAIEQTRIEAVQQAASPASGCQVAEGTRGQGMEASVTNFKAALNESVHKHMSGEEGPAKEGQRHALVAKLAAHCEYFASQSDVDNGFCQSVSERMPDADEIASQSLFFKEGGQVSTYNEERQRAAQMFIANVMGPTLSPQDKADANTPEGRAKAAYRSTIASRYSVASDMFSQTEAMRTPVQDVRMGQWIEAMGKKLPGFHNWQLPEGKTSRHDWLKIMSQQFLNPDFLIEATKDEVTATKDTTNMTAVLAFMAFEQYEMLEKISVLLATQLAIMNEGTRTDVIKN